MADLSKVKIGDRYYTLKDAEGRTLITAAEGKITAEETRAKGIEAGLDTRVTNLEARGRFLSNYNVGTGLPTTYPEIPSTATSTYTYTFKSGDYYIVGSVPASGTKYMPSGSSITATKSGDEWTWEVGKAVTTATISVGDQFVFDGTNWVHIAAAKDVAWGTIVGDLEDQTDLQDALDLKEDKSNLKALAYKDSASGDYTPAGSIGELDVTAAGSVTLNAFTQTATDATLTKGDFTPSGSITGSAISGGSIDVTVKDAATASEATLTKSTFTPAGTVAAVTGGSFDALKSASFGEDAENGVQIAGTVSKPAVDLTSAEKTFATSLKGGKVASFTEGAFTAASISDGFFSAGSHSFGTFNGGSASTLTDQSTSAFATEGLKAEVGSGDDAECLIFTAASTSNAVTDRGTFTEGSAATWTGASYTAPSIDTTKFNGGSKAADTFVANELQDINTDTVNNVTAAALHETPVFTGNKYKVSTTADTALKEVAFTATNSADIVTKAEYLKQEIDTKTFTPVAATLGFSGSKAENVIVTAVSYDKATANGASFTGTEKKVTPAFTGTQATITVE